MREPDADLAALAAALSDAVDPDASAFDVDAMWSRVEKRLAEDVKKPVGGPEGPPPAP